MSTVEARGDEWDHTSLASNIAVQSGEHQITIAEVGSSAFS